MMRRRLKEMRRFRLSDPTRSKRLYQWLLGGFTIWFILLFFVFHSIVLDLLATPPVPDWVIPYDKDIATRVREMTHGYPIEGMSEYIARFDEKTAGFLVSIAKKESSWGERVPVLDGRDCYNYWGFRDPDNTLGSGGHTCFTSPEQAVRQVGKRIRELVYTYDRDTPREMVVWKCGSSCSQDISGSVQKWISDVDWYYDDFMERKSQVLGTQSERN